MDGQDPTQKQIEVLQKAESCVTCTPSMVNSCCRTTQGATSTNTCTQQCQDYGTNTRLFDGSNCFCFDTKPTCDQLESSTQACKKGQNKNCFTGIALDKQKDKKSACETSCKVFGKDKTLVCKDKCYCLAPAKEPLKKKIVEHMDTCTSSCPAEYTCPDKTCINYITDSTNRDGYLIPTSLTKKSGADPDIGDADLTFMRCACDNSIQKSTDANIDLLTVWKNAIVDAPKCNVSLIDKFKELLPSGDDGLKSSIAQVMCKYSNMTDPRKAPPPPSVGTKDWFMNSLTSPVTYGFATFLIYLFYMRILLCTFYPRNTPAGTNPFLYSVFDAIWFKRNQNNADLWTVGIILLFVFIATVISFMGWAFAGDTHYAQIPDMLSTGFVTKWAPVGWFLLIPAIGAVLFIAKLLNNNAWTKSANALQLFSTVCFLFIATLIIALNLFIAYLVPSIAIIILLAYRIIASGVSAVSTLPHTWKDGVLLGLEWITGMTPADRWVIPFLPLLGMIAKVGHLINGTTSLYFIRQTLGTIIGCGDPNLFGS